MTKILVADDEADLEMLIRQKFRQQIRDQQYEFMFAANGNEALKKVQEHPDVEIILSDINMPEMDGLTLLSKLNEINPLIKAVMVSAYGDMENIRVAMNRGAFDFVTKPVNFTDLEITMKKTIDFVRQTKITLNAIRENNILKMYVDENVLKFMVSHEYEQSLTANETIEASVAFIDIIAQNGIVDKFIGDCVMAVFKGPFHLDRAIDACLAIRNKINALPVELNFTPKISIGINSGEMISGNIGSAALKRLDYTVIGDVVNIASRLQSVAGNNKIVITDNCFEIVKQSFECKKVGTVFLKNKAREVVIYEVLN